MSEKLHFPVEETSPEDDIEVREVPPAANWQMLRDMLTEEGKAEFRKSILDDLAEGGGLVINELLDELLSLINLSYRQQGEEAERTDARIQLIKQRLADEFPREEVERVERLNESLVRLDKYGSVLINGAGARKVMEDLLSVAPNKDDTQSSRLFVDLEKYPHISEGRGVTINMLSDDEPIELPIGTFISAEGLENWYGRQSGLSNDIKDGPGIIEDYASRSADTAPYIDDLKGYLTGDGRILFSSGNAHRLAAAIRRGDQTVKFRGTATIYPLDSDYPELIPDYYAQSPE